MIEETFVRLVDFIKSASEIMWTAARRQVYADMASDAIMAVVFLVMFIVLFKTYRHYWQRGIEKTGFNDPDADFGLAFVCALLAIAALVLNLVMFTSVIRMGICPEYYAIQNLVQVIP